MAKEKIKDDPTWRDQLYAYGFNDADIDEINVIPQHRFFIKMNMTFAESLKSEIKTQIEDTFCDQINEHYGNIMRGIERIEKKVDIHDKKLIILQNDVEKLNRKNSLLSYSIRGAIYIIIAVILFLLIASSSWYKHHFIGFFKNRNTYEWEQKVRNLPETDMGVTRGAKTIDFNKLTNVQKDSVIDREEKAILNMIK